MGWLGRKASNQSKSEYKLFAQAITLYALNLGPLNSFPACGNFHQLLITFADSLDQDQARQNVGPDLDPNCLALWWYSWKIFLKKLI